MKTISLLALCLFSITSWTTPARVLSTCNSQLSPVTLIDQYHSRQSVPMAYSPSGNLFLTFTDHTVLSVFDSTTWQVLHRFITDVPMDRLALSPDEMTVAVGGSRGLIEVFDISSEKLLFKGSYGKGIVDLKFTADGTKLLAGTANGTLVLNGRSIEKMQEIPNISGELIVSADGRFVSNRFPSDNRPSPLVTFDLNSMTETFSIDSAPGSSSRWSEAFYDEYTKSLFMVEARKIYELDPASGRKIDDSIPGMLIGSITKMVGRPIVAIDSYTSSSNIQIYDLVLHRTIGFVDLQAGAVQGFMPDGTNLLMSSDDTVLGRSFIASTADPGKTYMIDQYAAFESSAINPTKNQMALLLDGTIKIYDTSCL